MPSNKDLILEFQQQLESKLAGNTVDLGDYFCEDIAWHFPQSTAAQSSGSDHHGKTAVLAMFADVDLFYVADSMRFEYHSVTAEEDRVHLHYTLRATTTNGREYCNQYQSLFRVRDGKIAEVWEYFDTAYLFGLFAD